MIKFSLYTFLFFYVVACNQARQSKAHTDLADESLSKIDIIEKFFNNDNWMAVKEKDTSYFYFSRNNNVMKIYNYQIAKGDSANTILSQINFLNDSITWNYNNSVPVFLFYADAKKLEWKKLSQNPDTSPYIYFNKKDSMHINAALGNERFNLIKTLPFSTFLIRIHYDYLHGTRFAFSDTSFNK
ncbi:MAG: hypothetical protein JWO92_339 [Chitinophagaceae bacterium]|nr:hypothetical protein [Chitinophagaceae bacterium]MDB5222365.1 hypothetical protein [Chitinophagaceae bacterium]